MIFVLDEAANHQGAGRAGRTGMVALTPRELEVLGMILALGLAVFATVHISSKGIAYRQSRLWSSSARLLVTQYGFPEGRLFAQEPSVGGQPPAAVEQSGKTGIPVTDPNRFNALA